MTDGTDRSETTRAAVPCGDVQTLLAYEAGLHDAYRNALTSAKTMTREMMIAWLEAELKEHTP